MAHTPGPWTAKLLKADGHVIERDGWEIRTPGRDVVTWTGRAGPIRKEADARLIAAAPNLLAACEFAKQLLDTLRCETPIADYLLDPQKAVFEYADQVLTGAMFKAQSVASKPD